MREKPILRMAQVCTVSIISEASNVLLGITSDGGIYRERVHCRLDEIERLLKEVRFNLQESK